MYSRNSEFDDFPTIFFSNDYCSLALSFLFLSILIISWHKLKLLLLVVLKSLKSCDLHNHFIFYLLPFSSSWNVWCHLQPLNLEHYEAIRKMASEIQAYAPDARIMTTYYCGECFPYNLRNSSKDFGPSRVCVCVWIWYWNSTRKIKMRRYMSELASPLILQYL